MTTDNLLTMPAPETEDAEIAAADPKKPENVPDKFWDAEKGEVRVGALLASYMMLEKKLSQMIPLPQNDEDKRRIQKIMGVPDTAEGYQVAVPNDLFPVDPELNARLHAKGFTADQVQEVYDLAAEKLVPLILEMAAEFQADREIERLVSEFGGPDKWREVSRQLLAFGQKNLPPAVLDGLSCSYEGIMALYRMMMADEPGIASRGKGMTGSSESDLIDMMKNPKYWREKDPAYIARVTEGFEKIYGK
jgi:hypothetical protein